MMYDNFLGEPAERVFIFLINPLFHHPVHLRPPAFIKHMHTYGYTDKTKFFTQWETHKNTNFNWTSK